MSRSVWWGMTRYQWTVFLAAWIGWGFDVFDGLLFNFVAPVTVPRLLGIGASDPGGMARMTAVTGIVTSVLLIGWGTGGVLFGRVTDRLGRARTLQLTIMTYAGATAACAPFVLGSALGAAATPMDAIRWVALVPLVGLPLVPFIVETAPG